MLNRREFLRLAAPAVAMPGALPLWAARQESFQEITPEQSAAVERGLEWLHRNQYASGAIGSRCQVAFTGLAGLAFMASNSTPTRGQYARPLQRAVRFILRCCSRSGYINEGTGGGYGGSRMHGHGYATWFLAELYGMCGDSLDTGDESIREKLQRAVRLIEKSQDPTGGWTYAPTPSGHEGSVTITQVQALRSARNAGLTVDKKVIEKGISYIKKSTNPNGTIAYSLSSRGSGGTYALTAAGMCVFSMYGIYDCDEVKRGLKALKKFLIGGGGRRSGHGYYAHLYAAQVCFYARKHDPELWTKGFEVIRKDLLREQDASGAWTQGSYGGAFGTACATLILQIPYRYLPIFQD